MACACTHVRRVGLNPVYIERMDAKERKRAESGEATQQLEDEQKEEQVAALANLISTRAPATAAATDDDDGVTAAQPDEWVGVVEPVVEPTAADADLGTDADVMAALFADPFAEDADAPPPLPGLRGDLSSM